MQKENYQEAELAYRRALMIGPDSNKMCNLGICLLKQGKIADAKETLMKVRPAMADGPRGVESHLKAFERAQEMLLELEKENQRPSKPLSAAPPPFYPKVTFHENMATLKRTRSEKILTTKMLLPDEEAFDEAIVAAVLAPVLEAAAAEEERENVCGGVAATPLLAGRKVGKRLRVFQDITTQCVSPQA